MFHELALSSSAWLRPKPLFINTARRLPPEPAQPHHSMRTVQRGAGAMGHGTND